MRREEKRRKFHESLLNTLYPPLPQPQLEKDDEIPTTNFDVNLIPDDYGLQESSTSSSDGDDDGSESALQKLTRAQRKRLRKKKLKEDISRRKQLVGPLLPSPSIYSGGGNTGKHCTPPVRQNADDSCGDAGGQSKIKQRRVAKKLAKEKLKPSYVKDYVQGQSFDPINGENFEQDRKLKTIDGQI